MAEVFLNSLNQHLTGITTPRNGDKIYKEECVFSFDTPVRFQIVIWLIVIEENFFKVDRSISIFFYPFFSQMLKNCISSCWSLLILYPQQVAYQKGQSCSKNNVEKLQNISLYYIFAMFLENYASSWQILSCVKVCEEQELKNCQHKHRFSGTIFIFNVCLDGFQCERRNETHSFAIQIFLKIY